MEKKKNKKKIGPSQKNICGPHPRKKYIKKWTPPKKKFGPPKKTFFFAAKKRSILVYKLVNLLVFENKIIKNEQELKFCKKYWSGTQFYLNLKSVLIK